MRLSTLFGRTLREAPGDAEGVGHQLILRAGLARALLAGGFALLPLGMRVARRIETIMHEELERIGGQEFRTPVVQSSAAWEQSGRYTEYGPLMLRFTDRSERSLIFAPTHEEAVAELARREVPSYRQMPALVYQIHTKYRDEIRTRGGLMRMREFTMLDAYSLDADHAGLERVYDAVGAAFERIFTRCGVRFVAVEAASGEMGGREAREFMAISPSGEDTLVICPNCGYAANLEVAVSRVMDAEQQTTNHGQPTVGAGWRAEDEASAALDEASAAKGEAYPALDEASAAPDEASAAPDEATPALDKASAALDEASAAEGEASAALDEAEMWQGITAPEAVATPDCATIAAVAAFFGVPAAATAKAVFFDTPERGLVFAVIRGDLEVNEAKLRAAAGVSALAPATAAQIAAAGAVAGYASPVGLRVLRDDGPPTDDDGPSMSKAQHTADGVAERRTSDAAGDERLAGVFVIADQSVVRAGPLVAGANREGYHLRNVVYGRDWQATRVANTAAVQAGDPCADCGAPLTFERGVEIGHIFKLGTRYTEALGSLFLDQDGVARPVVMGSYGIGIERLIQIIAEQHHDEHGLVWPRSVAPLDIHLVRLGRKAELHAAADALYTELVSAGLRVLYDDRDESAGVKFNDADLIGLPLRIVISERLLAADQLELKPRTGEVTRIARADVLRAAGVRG